MIKIFLIISSLFYTLIVCISIFYICCILHFSTWTYIIVCLNKNILFTLINMGFVFLFDIILHYLSCSKFLHCNTLIVHNINVFIIAFITSELIFPRKFVLSDFILYNKYIQKMIFQLIINNAVRDKWDIVFLPVPAWPI
jgi:hypothetical protein